MRNFKTKIEGHEEEFDFECYENTEPIEIGDKYIFFLVALQTFKFVIQKNVKSEINKMIELKIIPK